MGLNIIFFGTKFGGCRGMTSHSDTRTLPIFPPTSPRSSLGRILGARWGCFFYLLPNLPPVALYVGTSTSIPPLLPALLLLAVIVREVRGGIVCAVFVIIILRNTTVYDVNNVDDPPPSSSSSSSYPPPSRAHEVDIVTPIVGVRVVLILVVIVVIVVIVTSSRSQMRSSRVVV